MALRVMAGSVTDSREGRPWILLPIETKAREFHGKTLMSAVAAARGYDVLLGEQNAMLAQADFLPHGIYIDKSVARTKTKSFLRLKALGNRIVAWCEEGLVYRHRDAYLHQRVSNDSLNEAERFFAWGAVQAEDIKLKAPEAGEKIRVSGNPRFDMLRPELREIFAGEASDLRATYGRYILINTNFSRYNHFMGKDFFLRALKQRGTVANAAEEEFVRSWSAFLGEVFHGFYDMLPRLSQAFPDLKLVVRPHPSEDHSAWHRAAVGLPNVEVIYQGSIVPWTLGAEATVHNSCTTGLESYLLDVPVAAFRPATSEAFDSHLPNAVSRQAFDVEDLVSLLEDMIAGRSSSPIEAKTEAERYIASFTGAFASERIVDELNDIAFGGDSFAPGMRDRARLTARHAVNSLKPLVRRFRVGARANAYARQKFPGISAAEIGDTLESLSRLTGRFADVRVESTPARNCFRITAE